MFPHIFGKPLSLFAFAHPKIFKGAIEIAKSALG